VFLACLVVSALAVIVPHGARAGAVSFRTPVIFDTDFYLGPDAVGGEAALLALNLRGEAQLIAMGVSTRFDRPAVAADSWKCMAAIAQFYGYPNIPIGSDMPDNGPPPTHNNFISPCAALASPHTPQPLSATEVYRKALAAQPDGSVVFVCTGYQENLRNLLNSAPDSFSQLNGAQLVAQKVQTLVIMGGGYPTWPGENNLEGNAGAARFVAANWPTKIVYSGYEVGTNVITGHTVSSVHPTNSPVRAALVAFGGNNKSITSFDLTAVYHAIRPTDPSLTEVGPGTNAISTVGANTFTLGAGNAYYLSLTNTTGLESSIETLWDTLPGTAAQTIKFTSTPPAPSVLGGSYSPSAVGGVSGNPVTLSIDPNSTSGCTMDGSGNVSFSAPLGTCIVDAQEPGSTTYAPALAQQTIHVMSAQTVSFTSTAPTSVSVGGTAYTPTATATSGLPATFALDASSTGCTLASGAVSFAGVGTCVIDATQGGSSTYLPAPVQQQSIAIGKGASAITIKSVPPSGPTAGGSYTPSATSNSGDAVGIALHAQSAACALVHGVVEFRTIGTCVIDFVDAGNSNYEPATTQSQTLTIAKGHLQLVAQVSPTAAKSGARITLTARTSVPFARGTVTFRVHSTTLCTVAVRGGVARCNAATHLRKGTYAVIATYSGSSSFYAATGRTRVTFT
jgi:inosine-uridine nucleoside N-ribohydrolase